MIGKLSMRVITFIDLGSIGGLHPKLWPPTVARVPAMGISRLPLGSHGTKCHLGAGHVANHKVYYKGEGGGFPQIRAVVNLPSPNFACGLS